MLGLLARLQFAQGVQRDRAVDVQHLRSKSRLPAPQLMRALEDLRELGLVALGDRTAYRLSPRGAELIRDQLEGPKS